MLCVVSVCIVFRLAGWLADDDYMMYSRLVVVWHMLDRMHSAAAETGVHPPEQRTRECENIYATMQRNATPLLVSLPYVSCLHACRERVAMIDFYRFRTCTHIM